LQTQSVEAQLAQVIETETETLETKTQTEKPLQCLYLTPHTQLAERISELLITELSQNTWLRILDYESFAIEIDPVLNTLETQTQSDVAQGLKTDYKRGIDHFITWCHKNKIKNEKVTHQPKNQKMDPNDYYVMLYHECKMIAGYATKKAYVESAMFHSLFIDPLEQQLSVRNTRFNYFVLMQSPVLVCHLVQ